VHPSGLVRANTLRTVPSLPEVSVPCSTTSRRWRPSAWNRFCSSSIWLAIWSTAALSPALSPPENGLAEGSSSLSATGLRRPVSICQAAHGLPLAARMAAAGNGRLASAALGMGFVLSGLR